jgi:hypothetical protein
MDPELARQLAAAADELYQAICAALTDARGVHLETALAAAGYLTGAALLRDAGVNLDHLQPGSHVIVDAVNQAGPQLLDLLFNTIHQAGFPNVPPADQVPLAHAPQRDCMSLIKTLQPTFLQIVHRHELPPAAHPYIAARAVGLILLAGKSHLDPRISKAIVAHAMVQGAKTVPPPIA